MGWIDITLPVRPGMPVWPGDPPYVAEPLSSIGRGDSCNVTHLSMSSHCGTHVDAPRHYFEDGAAVDALDLSVLTGPAYVLDLSHLHGNITAGDLSRMPGGVTRLLIRTANSRKIPEAFDPGCVGLTEGAAALLAERGVLLVGLDAWSVAAAGPEHDRTHRLLLSRSGAAALEAIWLHGVPEGWYELVCLPLRLAGLDGAPARAILREVSS